MSERQPSYWAVLPAKVRYDKNLRPNAKLLYAEITALAGAAGYCWATNEYLAQLFGISARTVSDLIGTLAKSGYVRVEVLRDPVTNEVQERRIWVDFDAPEDGGDVPPPLAKNGDTPIAENEDTPPAENSGTPLAENGDKNNIKIFNNNPPTPQRGRRRRGPKQEAEWKPERFEKFWKFYRENVRGEDRLAALKEWDKLKPDDATIDQIAMALLWQLRSEEWRRGIGIPYAANYLKKQRWKDKPKAPPEHDPPSGGGWAEDREVF